MLTSPLFCLWCVTVTFAAHTHANMEQHVHQFYSGFQKSSMPFFKIFVDLDRTGDLPLTLDVVYESVSATPERPNELSDANFDDEFARRRDNFERLFAQNFNLASKWSAAHVHFAQAALSNAVGGMAYFHGHSRVQRADGDFPVIDSWETPLFTAVPSRSFFPRGFLWDEGFHQLLISRFNPTLSLDAICHWLDLLNQDGWIPREQILDDEARSRVPDEFIVQRNNRANPPTLFLALDQLIDEGHVKNGELSAIYPRLVSWFNWFNTTQAMGRLLSS